MFTIIMCLLGIVIAGVLLRFMLWPLLKFAAQFIKWVVFTVWVIPILAMFLPALIPFYFILMALAAFCEVAGLELDTDCSSSCGIMDKLDEINAKL